MHVMPKCYSVGAQQALKGIPMLNWLSYTWKQLQQRCCRRSYWSKTM